MAETVKFMIFPDVKISELKADLERKRFNLENSSAQFKTSLIEFTNPLNLLKKHPLMFLGGLASGAAAIKAGLNLKKKSGWISKLFKFTGGLLVKSILPLAAQTLIAGLGHSPSKNRRK